MLYIYGWIGNDPQHFEIKKRFAYHSSLKTWEIFTWLGFFTRIISKVSALTVAQYLHKELAVDSPSGQEAGRQRSNPVTERSCVAFFLEYFTASVDILAIERKPKRSPERSRPWHFSQYWAINKFLLAIEWIFFGILLPAIRLGWQKMCTFLKKKNT